MSDFAQNKLSLDTAGRRLKRIPGRSVSTSSEFSLPPSSASDYPLSSEFSGWPAPPAPWPAPRGRQERVGQGNRLPPPSSHPPPPLQPQLAPLLSPLLVRSLCWAPVLEMVFLPRKRCSPIIREFNHLITTQRNKSQSSSPSQAGRWQSWRRPALPQAVSWSQIGTSGPPFLPGISQIDVYVLPPENELRNWKSQPVHRYAAHLASQPQVELNCSLQGLLLQWAGAGETGLDFLSCCCCWCCSCCCCCCCCWRVRKMLF